ncbi:hypothetical protein Tco_1351600 [Tanacetum coccineum]
MSAAIKRAEYHTLQRFIYWPSKAQDFCDGGSFPELHHARYSVDMGRKKDSSSGIRTLRMKHNEKAKKIAYSQQNNLVRMILKDEKEDDDKHTGPFLSHMKVPPNVYVGFIKIRTRGAKVELGCLYKESVTVRFDNNGPISLAMPVS